MANLLEKYGIKEVADVTFYDIDTKAPVLYLDTLKISTIENTAEEATATGGKGNSSLIVWDYGRDISVTLEDALFSIRSLIMAFGGKYSRYEASYSMYHSGIWTADHDYIQGIMPSDIQDKFLGRVVRIHELTFYDFNGNVASELFEGERYWYTGTIYTGLPSHSQDIIEISANTFPGTYYVTGDTYARSEKNGQDEFFQFIIPKAKVQSENTITLEADGEPSVFNFNLKVLYSRNEPMMKLVKYTPSDTEMAPRLEFMDEPLTDLSNIPVQEEPVNDIEYDDVTFNDLVDTSPEVPTEPLVNE